MKTGRKTLVLLLLILVIVAAVGAVISLSDDSCETYSANLYFINEAKTSIYPEQRDIRYEHKKDLPELVLEELAKGSTESGETVIPDNTSWYISEKSSRLMVDFSKEFLVSDNTENMLATYAVVKSLCYLDGVGAVKVTVEGEELVGLDDMPIGYLTTNDINIEEEQGAVVGRNVKLYFATENNTLSAEWRDLKLTDTVPVAESLINELIKGPVTEGLYTTLSPETKLISVEVADGVAYVNMSQGFVEKNKGSADKEFVAVYSVINTLKELPEIDGVQFLIEGKKESGFAFIDLAGVLS